MSSLENGGSRKSLDERRLEGRESPSVQVLVASFRNALKEDRLIGRDTKEKINQLIDHFLEAAGDVEFTFVHLKSSFEEGSSPSKEREREARENLFSLVFRIDDAARSLAYVIQVLNALGLADKLANVRGKAAVLDEVFIYNSGKYLEQITAWMRESKYQYKDILGRYGKQF